MKKYIAEFIGTFILVFVGTAAAVFGGGAAAGSIVSLVGIALAFGLAVMMAAYSIGTISGAHLNPAVSIAMFVNKRMDMTDLIGYIIAQVVGAFAGSLTLLALVNSAGGDTKALGQNLYGADAMINVGATGAFIVEAVLTFIFVLVIMTVTSPARGNDSLAGLVIGLTLTGLHFVGVPVTGMSVNPARSLAPAVLVQGTALSQIWLFILAPIVGGILAAIVAKSLLGTEVDPGDQDLDLDLSKN
ncbi:MIP/aquaporin family protein [Floricoccus penangensis]|uniref:Aquaporin n=1 Tax=Floricoccus penangensis TaxID=1859475 RepID=A0A9Q5JI11_9LACT|nr:MIP family channel protein [Floricoccus penangensis]OFI47731.1 aquaporin [Floricoccus penangensis]URZ88258.1 MIP family channel protein [Floricoccus penangensis]